MKYVKMLGLAVVAAMALMAFVGAGSASATTLCKTAVTTNCGAAWHWPVGTTIDASAEESLKLESGSTVLDTCTGGTVHGFTANTGTDVSSEKVSGSIESLTWTGCTVSTTTVAPGSLDITHIAGTDNGTVTGTGTEVTINTGFFGACTYGTSATGTDIGTLTGGKTATFDISATVPLIKNESGLCPSTSTWTGKYIVTSPDELYVSD